VGSGDQKLKQHLTAIAVTGGKPPMLLYALKLDLVNRDDGPA
jgi:hypothetical protein